MVAFIMRHYLQSLQDLRVEQVKLAVGLALPMKLKHAKHTRNANQGRAESNVVVSMELL